MKIIAPLAIIGSLLFAACSSDDNGFSDTPNATLQFKMTQNWDGESFTIEDFNTTNYTNAFGNSQTINQLRYLISHIELTRESGEKVLFENPYIFVDLEAASTSNPTGTIPQGNYTAVSFVFGFNEDMNTSGLYPELNSVSWNWPPMLGGGYHYLQMEGFYQSATTPQPYAYHMGTARESEGVFDNNHFTVTLNQNFTVGETVEIEIKMNLAEWFKNPHTWNLEEYNTDLMMNYTAQKMMHDNGKSVFSLGTIQ